jgi:co-chaperonin GroES (HSP10)
MDAASMTSGLVIVSPYSQGFDASGHSLEELFPKVDCEFEPFGARVVIQMRRVFKISRGGIHLPEETKKNEAYNMQVARIVKCGPLAFKRRDDGMPWPEGVWAKPEDFVKVLRFGGDEWSVELQDGGEPVRFRLLNDHDLLGRFTGDPLKVKAHIG